MSLEELSKQVEGVNERLLKGKTGSERQNTLESLMADEVLRNVEAGEVRRAQEGKRDFKYLEGQERGKSIEKEAGSERWRSMREKR